MLSMKRDSAAKDGPSSGQPWAAEDKKLGVEICMLPEDNMNWINEDAMAVDAEEPTAEDMAAAVEFAETVLGAGAVVVGGSAAVGGSGRGGGGAAAGSSEETAAASTPGP